jgi:hypothetical protein
MIWEYTLITHGGSFQQPYELGKKDFFTDRGNIFRLQPDAINELIELGRRATEDGAQIKMDGESGEVVVWIKPDEIVGIQFNVTKDNEPSLADAMKEKLN